MDPALDQADIRYSESLAAALAAMRGGSRVRSHSRTDPRHGADLNFAVESGLRRRAFVAQR
jgi:hypothetical protein